MEGTIYLPVIYALASIFIAVFLVAMLIAVIRKRQHLGVKNKDIEAQEDKDVNGNEIMTDESVTIQDCKTPIGSFKSCRSFKSWGSFKSCESFRSLESFHSVHRGGKEIY